MELFPALFYLEPIELFEPKTNKPKRKKQMKKLMMAMAAVAMVGAANAEASYEYNYDVYVTPYSAKDTKPGDAHADWYSCYGMKQATAQELLETEDTVDYNAMSDWLEKNFAENSAAVIEKSQALTCYHKFLPKSALYEFLYNEGDDFDDSDAYIGVVFFNNGADLAYEVMGDEDGSMNFFLDDGISCSGWIAVAPEPTSALLMLLGMAGLALKRRRA